MSTLATPLRLRACTDVDAPRVAMRTSKRTAPDLGTPPT